MSVSFRLHPLLGCLGLFALAGAAAPAAAVDVLSNGSFETGGLAPWIATQLPGSQGDWFVSDSTTSPLSGTQIPGPSDGSFQAVVDQNGSGTHILYQDVTLPVGEIATLRLVLWVENQAGSYAAPPVLDYVSFTNQQFRIDIMDPNAPIDDMGSGRLKVLFVTTPGTALSLPPAPRTFDLSEFTGQTIRIRIAEANNQGNLLAGVDSVSLLVEQLFEDLNAGLLPLRESTGAWGDYDGDGDLDLVLAGADSAGAPTTRLYRNDDAGFVDVAAGLPGASRGAVAWGDFDNDSDLDLALAGFGASGPITRLLRNDAGAFSDAGAGIVDVSDAALAWGDADNDGDLDLAIAGRDSGGSPVSRIYRNDGGTFSDLGAGLSARERASLAWGDVDGDGDLDLFLGGAEPSGDSSTVYRNDGGGFFDAGATLVGLSGGSADWGDFDKDGDLDLLLTGENAGTSRTILYRNDAGSFVEEPAGILGVEAGRATWGDRDADGDLDIFVLGSSDSSLIARIYDNDSAGNFSIGVVFSGLHLGWVAWGDLDGDRDLDLALCGQADSVLRSSVLRNNGPAKNDLPGAPGGLTAELDGFRVRLRWGSGTDAQGTELLTYRLRVGTTPGGSEIVSAMADPSTGVSFLPRFGEMGTLLEWDLHLTQAGSYFWSVQTVDAGFLSSPFAAERRFDLVTFSEIAAGLDGIRAGAALWFDFDGDEDHDLLLTGESEGAPRTVLYENTAGTLAATTSGLQNLRSSAAAAYDFDGDGDVDLALAGDTGAGFVSRVYRNDAGTFVDANAGLIGVHRASLEWTDLERDGDGDLIVAGRTSGGLDTTIVYRNDGGTFIATQAGLPAISSGDVVTEDFDRDGDPDALLTGSLRSGLFRNDGGTFVATASSLTLGAQSDLGWADLDASETLDIVHIGRGGVGNRFAQLLNVVASHSLAPMDSGDVAIADYDNDGDPDVIQVGSTDQGPLARLLQNDVLNGSLRDVGGGFTGRTQSSVAWGDVDQDADLDLVILGRTGATESTTLLRNESLASNTAPLPPGTLQATLAGTTATLDWVSGSDAETAPAALTYDLRLGTSFGGSELFAPQASTSSGFRHAPERGQWGHARSWTRDLPPAAKYTWSVQSIDAGLRGSAFAAEDTILLGPLLVEVRDIPGDQGGWVQLRLLASDLDDAGQTTLPVASYTVWRRVDDPGQAAEIARRASATRATGVHAESGGPAGAGQPAWFQWNGRRFALGASATQSNTGLPPGTWEAIGSFDALQQPEYLFAAPTRADSTSSGVFWSVFTVSAHTNQPASWFASDPDSGFSLDNIAPGVPQNVTAAYADSGAHLDWDDAPEPDFQFYRVYRDTDPGFEPDPGNLVHSTTESEWFDATPDPFVFHYRITTVDHAGNESAPGSPNVTTDAGERGPIEFALHGAIPNPSRAETHIRFQLPARLPVRLELYDLAGRRVRVLVREIREAGSHSVRWDGRDDAGRRVAAGVYSYRLRAGDFDARDRLVHLP